MAGWLETGILFAILAAGPAIALVVEVRARFRGGSQALRAVPAEPCWTEELGGNGRFRFQRAQCVDDVLMERDVRAARGEFPIPHMY